MFAGPYAPRDWAFCDGSPLAIAGNEALYSLLGTTFGGDGRQTFALPDLRGRVPVGPGTGPGLSQRIQGQHFGSEGVSLTSEQMPSHSHAFQASSNSANGTSPNGQVFGDTGEDLMYSSDRGSSLKPMNPNTAVTAGGGQPHDNTMPSMATNYIICLYGIYPSRS